MAAATKTMKAILCTKIGEPKEVLKLTELPIPDLNACKNKAKAVLVKVLFASINPIDYKMITGLMGVVNPKKPPFVAGRDFSGRVVAKGDDPSLRWLNVGDLVYGQCWYADQGSFAEYCLCESVNVQPMPKNLSPLQAAAIPLVSQTSYQAMLKMQLKKGDKLLILGGSTATGLAAIQMAKRFIECEEVVVTSSQIDLCKAMGADRVINYRADEVWHKECKDYAFDAIYDCVGGQESWDLCRSQGVLKKDGWFVTIVGDEQHGSEPITGGKLVGLALGIANRKFWGGVGYQRYDLLVANSKKNLRDVSSLIAAGKLKPVLDPESPFKMEEFLAMVEKSMAHKAKGKLIIRISEDEEDDGEEQKNDDNEDVENDAKEVDGDKQQANVVEEQENEDAPPNEDDGNADENEDKKEANDNDDK